MKVDNAIIMAAGTSSRFAPLSYERHKALTLVRNEILIERQIRQLKEAGIHVIYLITGYKAEQFDYLKDRFNVRLIYNPDFLDRNNNGSIWAAKDILKNSYVCSADNYFSINPFEAETECAYYAAAYAQGQTNEWCMTEDENGYIRSVMISGRDSWYMYGHTFWDEEFSKRFLKILKEEYDLPETKGKLWEQIFKEHLDTLKMKIRKYEPGVIYEFDTLDELRQFDASYVSDTRSFILKEIADELSIKEKDIIDLKVIKGNTSEAIGFTFVARNDSYRYLYKTQQLIRNEG